MDFVTTVTGSYPRKEVQKDTLRKSTVSEKDALEMIKWAAQEQANLGLDIITDEIFSISIRRISGYHSDPEKFLYDTGKDVANNFPHDQQKLISLLRKLGRGPINE